MLSITICPRIWRVTIRRRDVQAEMENHLRVFCSTVDRMYEPISFSLKITEKMRNSARRNWKKSLQKTGSV